MPQGFITISLQNMSIWYNIKTHRCCFDPEGHQHIIDQVLGGRTPKKYETELCILIEKKSCLIGQALSWSMFRVKPVRDLNSEEGLWGWAVITKYCYCTEAALTDTGRRQGRSWPISFSFHRLTPFSLSPIS